MKKKNLKKPPVAKVIKLNISNEIKGQLPIILRNEIQDNVDELTQLEGEVGKVDYKRWTNLFSIYCKFKSFGEATKKEKWNFNDEFYSFICEKFDFEKSQTYLYIKVAKCKALRDAKISISRAAIVMGSHSDEEIRKFREKHSDETISELTCRNLGSVMREFFGPKEKPKPVTKVNNISQLLPPEGKKALTEPEKLDSKAIQESNRFESQAVKIRRHLELGFSEAKEHFKEKDLTVELNKLFQEMFIWKAEKDSQAQAA